MSQFASPEEKIRHSVSSWAQKRWFRIFFILYALARISIKSYRLCSGPEGPELED